MKKNIKYVLLSFIVISCSSLKGQKAKHLTVINPINLERKSEVITLTKEMLKVSDVKGLAIKNTKTNQLEIIQFVDLDLDGTMDELLFQPHLAPNEKAFYEIVKNDYLIIGEEVCYSRFVPERTDDYAWENDKVAFRVYGPRAQKLKESGKKGGTLSSGVDAWLKRVEYPIINKWYKKHADKTGTYHKDTGEGLDNFHVGISRGVGGIAVKNNDKFYYSKNYTQWKTITTGPLRTSFYLEYANWSANGKQIKESRVITLDKGNNLSKFEISIEGIDEIYAGLTLHKKKGRATSNENKGWISYWEDKYADSELGTAILTNTETYLNQEVYKVDKKDLSNAYAKLKVKNNKVTYYAGFTWKKSKQYPTKERWATYLNNFSDKINNPLQVKID